MTDSHYVVRAHVWRFSCQIDEYSQVQVLDVNDTVDVEPVITTPKVFDRYHWPEYPLAVAESQVGVGERRWRRLPGAAEALGPGWSPGDSTGRSPGGSTGRPAAVYLRGERSPVRRLPASPVWWRCERLRRLKAARCAVYICNYHSIIV